MTYPDDLQPASSPPPPPPPGFGQQPGTGQSPPAPSPPPPDFSQAPPPPGYGQAPTAPPPPPTYGQPAAPGFGQPPAPGYPMSGALPATKPPRPAVPVAAVLLLVGAAVTVLGCVLNWFEVSEIGLKVNGFSTDSDDGSNDGPLFTFMAVVLAGFAITFLVAKRVFVLTILSIIAAVIIVLAGLADYGDVNNRKDELQGVFDMKVGPGLPVVILGGVIALAGAIVSIAKRRK